ncbi:hypothetical protein EI555_008436, partial [Monodon monoceros]
VLSQVLLPKSGPGLLKTLSLTRSVSGFSITKSADCWDWIPQPRGKELGLTLYNLLQTSVLTATVTLLTSPC